MAKLFIFSGNHKQIRKLYQTIAGTLFFLAFLYILLVNAQSALSTGIVLLKNAVSARLFSIAIFYSKSSLNHLSSGQTSAGFPEETRSEMRLSDISDVS